MAAVALGAVRAARAAHAQARALNWVARPAGCPLRGAAARPLAPCASFATSGASKGPGQGRRPKDPKAPKRPANAFAFFVKSQAAGRPGSGKDVMKTASVQWAGMDEAARAPFQAQAAADRERYDKEMSTYDPSAWDKRRKAPGAPKKPQNSFMRFSAERRAALLAGGMSITDAAKTLGAEWRALDDASKARYTSS